MDNLGLLIDQKLSNDDFQSLINMFDVDNYTQFINPIINLGVQKTDRITRHLIIHNRPNIMNLLMIINAEFGHVATVKQLIESGYVNDFENALVHAKTFPVVDLLFRLSSSIDALTQCIINACRDGDIITLMHFIKNIPIEKLPLITRELEQIDNFECSSVDIIKYVKCLNN